MIRSFLVEMNFTHLNRNPLRFLCVSSSISNIAFCNMKNTLPTGLVVNVHCKMTLSKAGTFTNFVSLNL